MSRVECRAYQIPPHFKETVRLMWKEEGEHWLRELPHTLEECRRRWDLQIGAPLGELSVNYLAGAVLADGGEAILKISCDGDELFNEVEVLKAFKGKGVVRVFETDRRLGAVLLQRLRPGTPLREVQGRDDEEATRIAAPIIRDLPIPAPAEHVFHVHSETLKELREYRAAAVSSGKIPAKMIEKAEMLFIELDASKQEARLVHGDLHHGNILLDQECGWTVIDPRGIVADPAFNAARLLCNPEGALLGAGNLHHVMRKRVEILSDALCCSPARIAGWGYVDSMAIACWSIAGHGSMWEQCLACAKALEEQSNKA